MYLVVVTTTVTAGTTTTTGVQLAIPVIVEVPATVLVARKVVAVLNAPAGAKRPYLVIVCVTADGVNVVVLA